MNSNSHKVQGLAYEKLHTSIRKEQIAEAAATLLSEEGVRGLSMTALAHRVGLVPSAIYRHFKTKEDVLFAAIDAITDRLLSSIRAACEETSDPLERLRLLLMRQGRMIIENRAIPREFSGDEIYKDHPERREKLYQSIGRYVAKVSSIIQEGQASGQFRHDIDALTLSLIYIGLWRGALPFYVHGGGRFNLLKHLEKAWKAFSDMLTRR
ncbi:MAG: TetR/AcrR family transcriptional regulator [Thermodesulfobacteriota bacterium]